MSDPVLQTCDLTKTYGSFTALDNLNISIDAGEIFCLLGANGAGKTTTINLFLNFISPTSGQALVDGKDVTMHPLATKTELAYIPETVNLYGHLTGLENLQFFTALAGLSHLRRNDLLELLQRVQLPQAAIDRRMGAYSKGMRQKVAIAIAIAKQPKALLLDEPTSGLDPSAANEFSQLLESLRDDGAAILMATHDLFRAKEVSTRLGIMRAGELIDTVNASDIDHQDLEQLYLQHMRS